MAVGMIKRCPACMRGYDSGKDSLVCPHCHAWLKERAALGFCPFCGHDLHVGKYCGRALPPPSFDMCICTGLPQIESPGADAQIVVLDPPKVRERPAWDEIWMEFAERLAQRSTCARASVGCVGRSGSAPSR